jgi:hypothetical protein
LFFMQEAAGHCDCLTCFGMGSVKVPPATKGSVQRPDGSWWLVCCTCLGSGEISRVHFEPMGMDETVEDAQARLEHYAEDK